MFVTLKSFEGISLKRMSEISLMKRRDKKYIIPINLLDELFSKLTEEYYVQDIEGKRDFNYATLYYDTPNYEMYHLHHNGKLNRLKIRTREYIDSNLCFLEIKTKSNKGITKKERIVHNRLDYIAEKDSSRFIYKNTPYSVCKIEAKLNTFYNRITLVNKAMSERVTIDYNLCFSNIGNNKQVTLPNLGIIEIKKEALSFSPVEIYLNQIRIKPRGLSKYCLGTALTDSSVKTNFLKPKILYLSKITPIIYDEFS